MSERERGEGRSLQSFFFLISDTHSLPFLLQFRVGVVPSLEIRGRFPMSAVPFEGYFEDPFAFVGDRPKHKVEARLKILIYR